jgi:(4S)-4-hydroxy-5-phosphonooxypentane-2,3-dione isomerase
MICLAVRLLVRPGHEQQVADLFQPLTEASRKEPGCVLYVAHQHRDDPRKFLVYEQYKDDAALEAHRNSEHFRRYAADGLYQFVESREADLYRPL